MHWILQENLFKESEWNNLIATLERFEIPYSVHKVIPFVGELVPEPNPEHENVVCFGSYSMCHSAKKFGWTPGVFDLYHQNFLVQKRHWGDMMLNYDSVITPFKNAHLEEPKFVRPIDDSKNFAGAVVEPKKIYAEYRFWIIDGRVVTSSLYKRGRQVIYSDVVDVNVHRFVDKVLNTENQMSLSSCSMTGIGWMPARAFVLDVCDTPDGMKIVEINTINSAGFYAANVQDLVLAIDAMKF